MSDNSIFLVEDECHKNQQMLLPVPWSGRTIIEERCDELEGHVMHLTQSEEALIEEILCKIVERSREQVGPAQDPGHEDRPPREETENVSGRRGF